MGERWRSNAARELVKSVRDAGGTVERTGRGRLRINGPDGSITIQEPSGDSRRDLRRNSAARAITDATGLDIGANADASKGEPK